MRRRWMGVAVLWAGLAVNGPARAQQSPYLPSPVGAARMMPDPLPCGPSTPPPNLVPGPVSPIAAPMGPPPCLDLPADHSSAFQCENYVCECGFYFQPGIQFLFRQQLGAGVIAVREPLFQTGSFLRPEERRLLDPTQDLDALFHLLPLGIQDALLKEAQRLGVPLNQGIGPFIQRLDQLAGIKSGLLAPLTAPPILKQNDLTPSMDVGYRGTLGLLWQGQALEYTSFFAFENDNTVTRSRRAGLNPLFFNAPPGFEGDNGLFLDADRVSVTFGSSLWNNELNYRWWNPGIKGADLIVGVRYAEQRENYSITTDEDGLSFPLFNHKPDPTLVTSYIVKTQNHFIGPQLGFEYTLPLGCWLTLGTTYKGAWGANIAQTENALIRGDGLVGFDSHNSNTGFAQMYDIGGYLEFNILERFRIKTGINAMWLTGLAVAVDQVDYNLGANPNVTSPRDGNLSTNLLNLLPVGTPQQAFTKLISRLLQRNLINELQAGSILQRVQNEPHGKQNFNGSVFYWGPSLELEFLF